MSTVLFVLGRDEKLKAVLSNEGSACPYSDPEWDISLNGAETLKFTVPADHPDSDIVDGDRILFHSDEDIVSTDYQEFIVISYEDVHDDTQLVREIICEHASVELMDFIVEDKRPSGTVSVALDSALSGTGGRWQTGDTDDDLLGTGSATFYYINAKEAINDIISIWGGEVHYLTRIEGNRIVGRFVRIKARRGADLGKRFEFDKDIDKVTRTIDASGVKTALYGRGKGEEVLDESGNPTGTYGRRTTFADVVWSIANGDPADKPAGQEWVGDPLALEDYGFTDYFGTKIHRKGVLILENETDPATLLMATWEQLQTLTSPLVQYEMDVKDLYALTGLTHEQVRLGDTVAGIDHYFSNPMLIRARIIQRKVNLIDPTKGKVILGNFMPALYDTDVRLNDLERTVTDNKSQWDSGGITEVTDSNIKVVAPAKVTVQSVVGGFKTVLLSWIYDYSISISAFEVYASQVQGFTPDQTNIVFNGKTGTFTHVVDTNQQWYYRVCAVNTQGARGEYSDEVMASTARIQTDEVMFGAITSEKLADLAVTVSKIADGSITTNKISEGAVIESALADEAITQAKIATGAVTSEKIAQGVIKDTHIDAGAISEEKMKWNTHLLF